VDYYGGRIEKFADCSASTPTNTPTQTTEFTQTFTLTGTPTVTGTATSTTTPSMTCSPTVTPSYTQTPSQNTPTITATSVVNTDVDEGDSYPAPQPGADHVNLVFNVKQDANVEIFIYNFAGKFIDKEEQYCTTGVNKVRVDTSKLPPGIYYYIINAKYNNSNEKFKTNKFYIMR
jgi:hypothetical protein